MAGEELQAQRGIILAAGGAAAGGAVGWRRLHTLRRRGHWAQLATMDKRIKVAQQEQRDRARLYGAVKGLFGAAVKTLKRMQWTILEDVLVGRVVDPRRVCPQSTTLAWQWRRVALHEGHAFLDRGAVLALLFAALHRPLIIMQEQAYLLSVIVDGRWTELRKYRAATHHVRSLAAKKAASSAGQVRKIVEA